jgi:hypothetical protein
MTIVPTQASPATQVAHANAIISDLDPYSDEALIEPWAMYQELQGLGSAVWLTRYQMFALTRYDSDTSVERCERVLVGIRRYDERRNEPGAARKYALQRTSNAQIEFFCF